MYSIETQKDVSGGAEAMGIQNMFVRLLGGEKSTTVAQLVVYT
jgi:hypothetical protein